MTASPVMLSRFATHEASAYPGLWRGCVGAWAPCLGPSGSRIPEYSRKMGWANLSFAPAGAYAVDGGQYSLASVEGSYATATINGPAADKTLCLWYRYLGSFTALQYVPLLDYGSAATGSLAAVTLSSSTGWGGNNAGIWGVGVTQYGDGIGTRQDDGRWHHVAITNSSTLWSVYVDGAFRTSKVMTTNTVASAVNIGLVNNAVWTGAFPAGASAVLDDIRIYDRVLNSEEIRLLARYRGIAYTPASRVLYSAESDAGGGGSVAGPVLFHSHYMSQGMRP